MRGGGQPSWIFWQRARALTRRLVTRGMLAIGDGSEGRCINIPFLFFCLVSGAIVYGAQLELEEVLMEVVDL